MLRKIRSTALYKIIGIVLIFGFLVQIAVLWRQQIQPWLPAVISISHSSSYQRSAHYYPFISQAQEEAIFHLRDYTPSDAVLIFTDSNPEFSWKPMLQYYLMPREIMICQANRINVCAESTIGEKVLLVKFPGFPELQGVPGDFEFRPMPGLDQYGLYSRE